MTPQAWRMYPYVRFLRAFDIMSNTFILRADVMIGTQIVGIDSIGKPGARLNKHCTVKQWKERVVEGLAKYLAKTHPTAFKKQRFTKLRHPSGVEFL
jgi:hypothetical protein